MKHHLKVDPKIRSKHEELIVEPVIIRVKEFNEKAAEEFSMAMAKAHNTGQPIIPVIIDSYGGQVYSLLAMIADIENARLPVATVAVGKAMSCGSVLLSCGAEGHRYIDSNATVMIHEVSSMEFGKIEEMKAGTNEADRLNKYIFHKMAKNCGHSDPDYFLKLVDSKKHADWFLPANEVKKHKLANYIKVPFFTTKITVDMKFGFE